MNQHAIKPQFISVAIYDKWKIRELDVADVADRGDVGGIKQPVRFPGMCVYFVAHANNTTLPVHDPTVVQESVKFPDSSYSE